MRTTGKPTFQNLKGVRDVLKFVSDNGGRVSSNELRKFAADKAPTASTRDNLIHCIWMVGGFVKTGNVNSTEYILTTVGVALYRALEQENL